MSSEHGTGLLTLEVEDVAGQNRYTAEDVPADATVAELIDAFLDDLALPKSDVDGRRSVYTATLDGLQLDPAQRLDEAIGEAAPEQNLRDRSLPRFRITPSIDAG